MNTEWKPIASAPKGQLVMVYTPPQPSDWPDTVRIGFDFIDSEIADDYWYNHGEHYEHYCCVAKPENCTGPQECAPYTHWMPLPAAPCTTCNGHGMIGGPSFYAPDEGGEPCPDCSPPAPTSHPIPTGATADRDWELCCDNCAGTGYILIDRQVAERKTDVQEFKEECEICAGRGFNIAFEDIPGIAEYVKSCRPASTVATEGEKDERQAFEEWFTRNDETKDMAARAVRRCATSGAYALMQTYTAWEIWRAARASVAAPAAGDALDAELERHIDGLRLKAFRTNAPDDRHAYFEAVSKWFQERDYRALRQERRLRSGECE